MDRFKGLFISCLTQKCLHSNSVKGTHFSNEDWKLCLFILRMWVLENWTEPFPLSINRYLQCVCRRLHGTRCQIYLEQHELQGSQEFAQRKQITTSVPIGGELWWVPRSGLYQCNNQGSQKFMLETFHSKYPIHTTRVVHSFDQRIL